MTDAIHVIDPVKRDNKDGRVYVRRYTFESVAIEEVDDVEIDGLEFINTGDEIHWKYRDKPKVIIKDDKVWAKFGESNKDAEEQAYFALSILDAKGYVSHWRQV